MSESPDNPLTPEKTPIPCQYTKNKEIKRRELAAAVASTPKTSGFHPRALFDRWLDLLGSIKKENKPELAQATSAANEETFEELKNTDRPETRNPIAQTASLEGERDLADSPEKEAL